MFNSQKANFKVETLVKGLDQPWGMAFLPDGRMIFTERAGRLRFMDKNGNMSEPVKGTPSVFVRQDGGMLDVALHPDYARNGWIYLSYSSVPPGYQVPAGQRDRAQSGAADHDLYRARQGQCQERMGGPADPVQSAARIPIAISADHYGSRFLFDRKGHFFWSMGERHDMQMSQNLASPLGKIHRLNEDGSDPKGQSVHPHAGRAGQHLDLWPPQSGRPDLRSRHRHLVGDRAWSHRRR